LQPWSCWRSLGIDNLVFIAILADKLPPHQRDRARVIGLALAR
jgi:predicted tellurium resistance membrane protein TerC